jgi:hypothetical protein
MLIKKFYKFIKEDYETSFFNVGKTTYWLYVKEDEICRVYIMLGDDIYEKLSIDLPNSTELDDEEFFLNPNIDKKIIDVLINQNFISEGNKEAIAGDKKTKSFYLV